MRVPKELDGLAKEHWQRHAPNLERLGLLTDLDRDSFALLCVVYARLYESTGLQFVALVKQYTQLAKSFGLDPLSRKRLGVDLAESKPDEFGI